MTTLYNILGIEVLATPEKIKDAYRAMAMKWHPDRNPNNRLQAEAKFKEIGAAYKVLYDPEQRREYDDWLSKQRQNSSQDTFVNTVSEADAEQMFYDSMLDLAIELVKRGFDLAAITKVLKSLDCPDAIARVVTLNAIKIARNGSNNSAKQSQPKALKSIEEASWPDIEAYYTAVIGGTYADDRMVDPEYQQRYIVHSKQMKLYLIGFVVIILSRIFGFVSKRPEIAGLISLVGVLIIIGIVIWRIFTNNSKFNREKTMRYYLTAFECYHDARPMPLRFESWNLWPYIFNVSWFAYRRMPVIAFGIIIIEVIIVSGQLLYEISEPSLSLAISISSYIFIIVVGLKANKLYFKSAQKRINTVLRLPRDRALLELRKAGGRNLWSWILFWILLIILLIPTFIELDTREKEKAAVVAQQQADELLRKSAEQQAQAEAKAQADAIETKKVDALIAELQAKYPVLNDNSPQFNQKVVDEVLARQKAYIDQGKSVSNALQLAIDDMTRPASPKAEPSVTY